MTDSNRFDDALQQLATHVAAQLVADALKAMVATKVMLVPVTVEAQTVPRSVGELVRRQLAPAPAEKRRGRKPGPKPKKAKKGQRPPWTAAQRAKFSRTMAARRGTPAPKAKVGRPRKLAPTAEERCTRCDHTAEEHDGNGKCLSFRCACVGLCR